MPNELYLHYKDYRPRTAEQKTADEEEKRLKRAENNAAILDRREKKKLDLQKLPNTKPLSTPSAKKFSRVTVLNLKNKCS